MSTSSQLQERHDLVCQVENSFEALESGRKEWDDFVLSVGGDIYMTYDWCRIWWSYYGKKRILAVLIFRMNDQLAGILPFFIEQLGIGPVSIRTAKLLGSDFTLSLCHPPVRKAQAVEIFRSGLELLAKDYDCDAIFLAPVSEKYYALIDLENASVHLQNILGNCRIRKISTHTLFHLPAQFDDYLQSLDKRQRGNYRRDMNLLNKDFRLATDVISERPPVANEFEDFVRMHEHQWKSENMMGQFGDWPRSIQFNRDLIQAQAKLERVRFYRLLADDTVVSSQYCFVFGKSNYWRLPARVVGNSWDKYGFGRIGLISMIEENIQEGIKVIEAGQGHYDYKNHLGGCEYSLLSVRLIANKKGARLRTFLLEQLSRALQLFYYRIWFCRIAPRLKYFQRPLWEWWIRTRL